VWHTYISHSLTHPLTRNILDAPTKRYFFVKKIITQKWEVIRGKKIQIHDLQVTNNIYNIFFWNILHKTINNLTILWTIHDKLPSGFLYRDMLGNSCALPGILPLFREQYHSGFWSVLINMMSEKANENGTKSLRVPHCLHWDGDHTQSRVWF